MVSIRGVVDTRRKRLGPIVTLPLPLPLPLPLLPLPLPLPLSSCRHLESLCLRQCRAVSDGSLAVIAAHCAALTRCPSPLALPLPPTPTRTRTPTPTSTPYP